jgi:hypothetical protein
MFIDMQGLEQTLQEVCEECEELLVEAGRKFRLALSLDRTDMRALYNWGLALCHRAQLISEEGGEVGSHFPELLINVFERLLSLLTVPHLVSLLRSSLPCAEKVHP